MKQFPPVSIFIVTCLDSRERGEILKATCESALAQNYPDFEVVVSDNAGAVHASDVLSSIQDSRLKVFRNESNLGMAPNMNLCVERCAGDIIKVNCDDDLLHPDCLRLSVPHVNDDTLVLVGMKKFKIGETPEGMKVPVEGNSSVSVRTAGYGKMNDLWKFSYDGLPGCTLFTRGFFLSLGRYDERSNVEDWDLLIMSRLLKSVCYVDFTLCFQGVWPESLTVSKLVREPYFFPQAGLYTKFKVLHGGMINRREAFSLKRMLFCDLVAGTLRVLKHMGKVEYRRGYAGYLRVFRSRGL